MQKMLEGNAGNISQHLVIHCLVIKRNTEYKYGWYILVFEQTKNMNILVNNELQYYRNFKKILDLLRKNALS